MLLRRFTNDDVDAFFAIMSDEEVNKFLPLFLLKTKEKAAECLEEYYLKSYEKDSGYRYAICLKPDNVPIGYVNVSSSESYDFGYGLIAECWHQGIITEASQAVVGKLRIAGVPFITATHDIYNPRSGNVMKKLGMTYRYSYEELWQPKNRLVTFRMYQLNLDGDNDRTYQDYWNKYPVHFIEENV